MARVVYEYAVRGSYAYEYAPTGHSRQLSQHRPLALNNNDTLRSSGSVLIGIHAVSAVSVYL